MFANIPEVKLGIVAVSRDCFPIGLSQQRRKAIKAAYTGELYECPVTVENEKDMLDAVADVRKAGVGPSLCLTVPILVGGTALALALAMLAAAHRGGSADRAVLLGSTFLMSVNYVVWILAGQFFLSYRLGLFPIWGFEGVAYIVLPAAVGIASGLGRDVRYFRTVLLDEMNRPYVRTALSKGLPRRRVFWGHVLPNALIPVVTYVSLSIPYLFTGSLLLESFFGIPGLGGVSINAVNSADLATVRAVVILGALLYQLVNLATDLCYAWLDPRVRMA